MADRYFVLPAFVLMLTFSLATSNTLKVNITQNITQTAVLLCPNSSDINVTLWSGPPLFAAYNVPGTSRINEALPNADRLEIDESNAALLIHNVTLGDEGVYRCYAAHVGTVEIQLFVTNIPPALIVVEETEILGNREIVHGTEDQNLTLTCLVDGGKPEPNITWSMLNANESLQSNTSITEHDNGTFTVSSSYTFMANRSMDGEEFVCNGFHPALQTPMEYRVVIYLVLKPQLVPTEEQIITTEGYNATIRCEVWGARPEANISLSFNGEETTDHRSVHNQSSDTYTTVVETSRVMKRTDNGKHVSCIISHLALPIPLNRTLTTIVYYPPSVSVSGENTTANSDALSLRCIASNGNPDNYTFSPWRHTWPSYSKVLREIESTSANGNEATLKLENLTYQDSGVYTCLASNGVGILNNPDFLASQEIVIVVKESSKLYINTADAVLAIPFPMEPYIKLLLCTASDAPYVIDGRTEYYMTVEEKIEIVLGVYTNVEPLIVTVERNSDVVGRTAIWMIGKTQETVVIPVYNYDLFTQGYKIVINFQVQAEKNYGAYRILLRNDVGSTAHNFTIMSRVAAMTSTKSPVSEPVEDNTTTIVAAVVGSVVPVCIIVAVIIIVVYCLRIRRQTQDPNAGAVQIATSGGKKFVKDSGDPASLYDYINPTDDGYLNPQPGGPPGFKARCVEYTRGDEKLVIKEIQGPGSPPDPGLMRFPSVTDGEPSEPSVNESPTP